MTQKRVSRADLLRGRFAGTDAPSLPAGPQRAAFAESCLARQGTACRACEDPCPAGAIRFQLRTGGRAEPDLRPGLCDGCGDCLPVCPAGAISLIALQIPDGTAAAIQPGSAVRP